jgi:hypothetical protein
MQTPAQRFLQTGDRAPDIPKLAAPPILRTAPLAEQSPVPTAVSMKVFSVNQMTIKLDKIVPPSGNMMIAQQQIWLGPARAGQPVTFWANTSTIQILSAGTKLKTVPSRLNLDELHTLLDGEATQVDALPITTGPVTPGGPIETERLVNAVGHIGLANRQLSVGSQFAGRRLPIRVDNETIAEIPRTIRKDTTRHKAAKPFKQRKIN